MHIVFQHSDILESAQAGSICSTRAFLDLTGLQSGASEFKGWQMVSRWHPAWGNLGKGEGKIKPSTALAPVPFQESHSQAGLALTGNIDYMILQNLHGPA